MKKRIYFTLLAAVSLLFFTACGSSGDSDGTIKDATIEDIRLSSSMSQVCTDETSFTVTPAPNDEPIINIIQNVKTKNTLIEVESSSIGYVIISNCTRG